MGLFDDIFEVGGAALGFFGGIFEAGAKEDYYDAIAADKKRIAETNAQISLYDAEVAEKDAFYAEQSAALSVAVHMKKLERIIGTQRTRYAKSGVAVGSGSPLEVELSTLEDGLRDIKIIAWNGKTAAERRRSLAQRYRMLAEAGLRDAAAQASLMEDAGNDAWMAGFLSSVGELSEDVYGLGKGWGWW